MSAGSPSSSRRPDGRSSCRTCPTSRRHPGSRLEPARRLATALRLPRLAGERTTIKIGGGRTMDALQLDTKRTFDELVERFASSPAQLERVMTNPYYRRLADTLGGTHEYMAMEK